MINFIANKTKQAATNALKGNRKARRYIAIGKREGLLK